MANPQTKKFKLVKGKHFFRDENGNEVEAKVGDYVPLTKEQFEAFRDKFESPQPTVQEESGGAHPSAKQNVEDKDMLKPGGESGASARGDKETVVDTKSGDGLPGGTAKVPGTADASPKGPTPQPGNNKVGG